MKRQVDRHALTQKTAFTEWFSYWPWEALITVRTPAIRNRNHAHEAIKKDVIRPLALHLKTQLATLAVVNFVDSPHVHCLTLSKDGALSGMLASQHDTSLALQALRSRAGTILTHKAALDLEAFYSIGGCSYTAGNLTYYPDHSELFYYNRGLLEKSRLEFVGVAA
jgi:hypothetical protein